MTYHTFYSFQILIDKLKSKQHLISQELVCSCFAIKKTKKHSSQEVCMKPLTKYTCIMQLQCSHLEFININHIFFIKCCFLNQTIFD